MVMAVPPPTTNLPPEKAENLVKCLINEFKAMRDEEEALTCMNELPREQAGEIAAHLVSRRKPSQASGRQLLVAGASSHWGDGGAEGMNTLVVCRS